MNDLELPSLDPTMAFIVFVRPHVVNFLMLKHWRKWENPIFSRNIATTVNNEWETEAENKTQQLVFIGPFGNYFEHKQTVSM